MPDRTEADAVAALVDKNKTHTRIDTVGAQSVIVFSDKATLPLERFADNPRRKRARVEADDQDSFARYVNAHKVAFVTALFGRITDRGGSFSGIFDFHTQNVLGEDGAVSTPGTTANWGDHRIDFVLGFTPEWKRWTEKDGVPMSQVDFAEFIEDNLPDIVKPAAADLLEVVQDLVAKKNVDFKSSVRLQNGQTSLVYDETISTNKREGQIDVPNEFTVAIAPFRGSAAVGITARLRFRINEGHLQFIYKLNQPSKVLDAAFDSARGYIAAQTGTQVLLGSAAVVGAPAS